jgi:hypothetical protein
LGLRDGKALKSGLAFRPRCQVLCVAGKFTKKTPENTRKTGNYYRCFVRDALQSPLPYQDELRGMKPQTPGREKQ